MKVCYLIDSLTWGGAEKLVLSFAEASKESELTLTVAILRQSRSGESLKDMLEALGVQVILFEGNGLRDLKRLRAITKWLRQSDIQLVHTHLAYSAIIGGVAGWLSNIPVVTSIHSEPLTNNYRLKQVFILETIVIRTLIKQVIMVGHKVAQSHRSRLGRRKPLVISNAVAAIPKLPDKERNAYRSELTLNPAGKLLITVGRLDQQKGCFDLIEAFAQICRQHPDTTLLIVGRGNLADKLAQHIEAHNLDKNAHLLGIRNDVPKLLAASDMYVSASHQEGLPVSVLEAMSAGLPVVATAVGDIPVLLGEGRGKLVAPHQPQHLAEAVSSVLANPRAMEKMGHKGQTFVRDNYSVEAWVDQFLALYRNLINGKNNILEHKQP